MARRYPQEVPVFDEPVISPVNIPQVQPDRLTAKVHSQAADSAFQLAHTMQEKSIDLYKNEFRLNAMKQIEDISARFSADPDGMRQEFAKAYEGLKESASPLIEPELDLSFEIMAQPYINRATHKKNQLLDDELTENKLKLINQAMLSIEKDTGDMLSSDPKMAFDAARSIQLQLALVREAAHTMGQEGEPIFSAAQRVKFEEGAKSSIFEGGLRNWFDTQKDKAGAYKRFLDGNIKLKLPDENGNITSEISPLDEMDRGSFEKLRNYMETKVDEQLKEAKKGAEMARVQNKLAGDIAILDPKDKKDRKAIDAYFDNAVAPQLQGRSEAEKSSAIAAYVQKTGMVPKSVAGVIRGTLRAGSPEQQVFAADLIARIQENAPQALADIGDPKDMTYGLLLSKYIRAGVEPERAIESAQKQFDPTSKEIISMRRAELKKRLPVNPESEIRQTLKERSFFGFNQTQLPEIPNLRDSAIADYKSLYESAYLETGDTEVAKKTANEMFARTYGVSELSGAKRVMRYPPELYYSIPGVSNDWMKKQLAEAVQAEHKEATEGDIVLMPDSRTAREAQPNGRPSYVVLVKDPKNAAYNPVTDKEGKLRRFVFDPESELGRLRSELEKEKEQKALTGLERGQKKRQAIPQDMKLIEQVMNEQEGF